MHTLLSVILVLSVEEVRLNANDCESFYCEQVGGGNYFHGIAHQRGHGYLRDIGRRISSYLVKAGRYLGRQLFQTGKNVITDVSSGSFFSRFCVKQTSRSINENKTDIFENCITEKV